MVGGTLLVTHNDEPKTLLLDVVMKRAECTKPTQYTKMQRWLNTEEGIAFTNTYPPDIFVSRVDDPHYT